MGESSLTGQHWTSARVQRACRGRVASYRSVMSDQSRRADGKFRTTYPDERRYELLRRVAFRVSPLDPASLSQPEFDRRAPEVAAQQGWPRPPKANAIYMYLTRKRKRSWRELVADALVTASANLTQRVGATTREFPAWWFDERHIVYGLRRLLHFRQEQEAAKPEGQRVIETLAYHEYDVARQELLDSVRGERRDYLDLILPTAGQIVVMAGRDWNMALRLAGLPIPEGGAPRAIPLVTLAEHYYQSERRIPTYKQLASKYAALELAVPRHPPNWGHFLNEWRADRAARGMETPPDGPPEGQQLSETQLDDLLAGALRRRDPHERWTPESILDRFCEYVAEYDGVTPLTERHYKAVRKGRGWPEWGTIYEHATSDRKTTWREMVERGRRRVAELRRAA